MTSGHAAYSSIHARALTGSLSCVSHWHRQARHGLVGKICPQWAVLLLAEVAVARGAASSAARRAIGHVIALSRAAAVVAVVATGEAAVAATAAAEGATVVAAVVMVVVAAVVVVAARGLASSAARRATGHVIAPRVAAEGVAGDAMI